MSWHLCRNARCARCGLAAIFVIDRRFARLTTGRLSSELPIENQ
jgi:hypothetical protein